MHYNDAAHKSTKKRWQTYFGTGENGLCQNARSFHVGRGRAIQEIVFDGQKPIQCPSRAGHYKRH